MRRYLLPILVGVCTSVLGADRLPNLIVFYTDDHGHADLGILGAEKDVKTPNIDALARSGVLATHGYSTAPQCVPSRGGLMTGKFQGRFNLDNNGSALDGFNKETTLATRLQNAGYATAQFGKWHLGPTPEIPTHGFKHCFAQNAQAPFSSNITLDGEDRQMGILPPTMYHIDGCSHAAAAIIERYKDQPFFLYVAFRAPHTPLDAPASYKARFPGEMPERRRAALAMISAVDDGVGLVTNTLKKCGLTEKTLIFLIGDNGAPLKMHKVDSPLDGDAGGWDGSLNTPLNGEKGMLTEGGMSTPFVVAWPGKIPGGQTYSYPVSALDVAATAVAMAGVSVKPGDLDGVNLLPHLTGENKAPPHDALYWRWSAQSAIREGDWKLLRGGEREYLFNLSADREEKHNLASQEPAVAARLRTKLQTWAAELNPAGMALSKMVPIWTEYFDHYLDGKIVPAAPREDWLARNGKLTEEEGVYTLTPAPGASNAFITRTKLRLRSPVTVRFSLKTQATGSGAIAWRDDGDKDFLPENRTAFTIPKSEGWQAIEVKLPTTSTVIHLRIQPPPGPSMLRDITFGK